MVEGSHIRVRGCAHVRDIESSSPAPHEIVVFCHFYKVIYFSIFFSVENDTTLKKMENWKDVVGFPGYTVSDLGQVRGKYGRIFKPQLVNGYHQIHLYGEKKKTVLVHRLVAAAFLGPCPAGKEVDHGNRVRTDNRAVNLQYLTPSENMRKQPKRAGCASNYIGVTKNRKRWAAQVTAEKHVYLGTFDTQEEAARVRDKYYRDKGQLVTFNFE
jgi:hypothetical protein